MFRSFEDITSNIGAEFKNTARLVCQRAKIFVYILAVLTLIIGIVIAIDHGSFGVFIAFVAGSLFELAIFMSTVYLITINLYGKGEVIHLLAGSQSVEISGEEIAVSDEENIAGVQSTAETLASNTWVCNKCNTENSMNYGQCKKCGKYR